MELRVWNEGIERVICGVTELTTCRDVIVALARIVGRTGRYSLVETYHGHQRRLPASERLHARLSERAASARLTLVCNSRCSEPRHDDSTPRRMNSYVDASRQAAPLNKSRSVGCCRSLVAAGSPPPPRKDERRSKSSKKVKIAVGRNMQITAGAERSNAATGRQRPSSEWNAQQRGGELPARTDHTRRRRPSPNSAAELIQRSGTHNEPAERLRQAASERRPVPERNRSPPVDQGRPVAPWRCVLHQSQTSSRDQLLQLLTQQQDQLSRRLAELSNLNSEISRTEDSMESLKRSEQSLSAKLSELEKTERRVDEELEELELVSWHEKLEMSLNRCTQLENEAEALASSVARSQRDADQWQQRVNEITAETETVRSNCQQMETDKTRLKQQLDKLELKLTESRRQNHDRHSALQQVGKTIDADAARLEHQLTQQRRLETMQNAAAAGGSKFQRSLSFDSETRAKNKLRDHRSSIAQQTGMAEHHQEVNVAFSCQI